MVLSFVYLAFSAVLRLLVGGRRRSEFATDVELLVLRHLTAREALARAPGVG